MATNRRGAADSGDARALDDLDPDERKQRDDFIQLMREALALRDVYIDPRRGLGGEQLEGWEIDQLREQYSLARIELDRELLRLSVRAAALRDLVRPPLQSQPLPPGYLTEHSAWAKEPSTDELWQTAVAWGKRWLDQTPDTSPVETPADDTAVEEMAFDDRPVTWWPRAGEPMAERRDRAIDSLTRGLLELMERGRITNSLPTEWSKLRHEIAHVLEPTAKSRTRDTNYIVERLAALSGVAKNTILAAVKRAETPRSFAKHGTTLVQRESMLRGMYGEQRARQLERAELKAAKDRAAERSATEIQKAAALDERRAAAELTQRQTDEITAIVAGVRARLPEATDEEILAEVDAERAERAGRGRP